MGEYDVDDLLERAFQKVEEFDKSSSKSPMDDLIMKESRKAGVSSEHKESESKKRKGNGSDSEDEERGRSQRKRRSRSRDGKTRGGSRDRRHRSGSPRPESESRKKRSRSRDRRRRSRSRSPHDRHSRRHRTPDRRRRSRSRSPWKRRSSPSWRRSPPRSRLPGPERRDVLDSLSMPFTAKRSPPRNAKSDMTAEERDERTIFILQLSRNTRPKDLEEFFSSVGHVRDVRIITDSKTRRSKGIAYVEFWEKDAISLAMGLNGQRLLNAPLVIQMTCAERNRIANGTVGGAIGLGIPDSVGPLKMCVSNLHLHITDEMLSAIFEPFGKIDRCEVVKDGSNVSKGYGYVRFRYTDEGKKAIEQLNGFELAGKNIRITLLDEDDNSAKQTRMKQEEQQQSLEDNEHIGSQGRLQLMAKLAEGSGMEVPQATKDAIAQQNQVQNNEQIPSIATQCFMLSNMFDPTAETEPGWELDIRDSIIGECISNGGIVHIYVDSQSPQGNVYVKCPSVAVAHRSVATLHGRWFAGKVITANYVPVNSYHDLFPDARNAVTPLALRDR